MDIYAIFRVDIILGRSYNKFEINFIRSVLLVKKTCICVTLFFMMTVIFLSSAQAITVIKVPVEEHHVSNTNLMDNEPFAYDKALILESANLSSEKPTLFFFGGIGERSSAKKTAELLKGTDAYEDWNVVAVAVVKDRKTIREWEEVADSLCLYVLERVMQGKIDPQNIWIDTYSNGTGGGLYTSLKLHNMLTLLPDQTIAKVKVQELTMIEGTLTGIVKSPQIEQLLQMGIPVTLYVSSTASSELSANGRKLIKEFNGRENFTGILVNHGHGNKIVSLVSESYGNHQNDGFSQN